MEALQAQVAQLLERSQQQDAALRQQQAILQQQAQALQAQAAATVTTQHTNEMDDAQRRGDGDKRGQEGAHTAAAYAPRWALHRVGAAARRSLL